jgi:predicted GNAT superfamily acetyltransferase
MRTEQFTDRAAERLAALIELAQEHDDELSYIEVEQLVVFSSRQLAEREEPYAPDEELS